MDVDQINTPPQQPIEIVVRYEDKLNTLNQLRKNDEKKKVIENSESGGDDQFSPRQMNDDDPINLSSNDDEDEDDDNLGDENLMSMSRRRRRNIERQLSSLSDEHIDEFEAIDDEDLKFCFPNFDSAKETAELFVKKVCYFFCFLLFT